MAEPTFPIVTGFKGLNNKLDPTPPGRNGYCKRKTCYVITEII